eukprot:COSAG06_NODE_17477_length_939_cov_0.761905_2_plen_38_part_01
MLPDATATRREQRLRFEAPWLGLVAWPASLCLLRATPA